MMTQHWSFNYLRQQPLLLQRLFDEMRYNMQLLSITPDAVTRNILLNQLWMQLNTLQQLQASQTVSNPMKPPNQADIPSSGYPLTTGQYINQSTPSRTFTEEELTNFTGTNGKPAYVAVNGIVYDVTNNAAWAAATHFGLRAGQDLTAAFASCHAGQQWILQQLTPVGRLTNGE
ncbi:cytochrome b5 domain-containing protein [Bacillus tianshenii]|nr:cytochrome b5 domain-containing protein [Bacillus tianshenii]